MTVHHQKYYSGAEAPPADWDDPNPIPFLTFSGLFLLALHAPDASAWAKSGYGILKMALKEKGIGGKTSSGYGRLKMGEIVFEMPEVEEDVVQLKAENTLGFKVVSIDKDAETVFLTSDETKPMVDIENNEVISIHWYAEDIKTIHIGQLVQLYIEDVDAMDNGNFSIFAHVVQTDGEDKNE